MKGEVRRQSRARAGEALELGVVLRLAVREGSCELAHLLVCLPPRPPLAAWLLAIAACAPFDVR
jgi:hypothetical protein